MHIVFIQVFLKWCENQGFIYMLSLQFLFECLHGVISWSHEQFQKVHVLYILSKVLLNGNT